MDTIDTSTDTAASPGSRITLLNRIVRRLGNPLQELLSFPWLVVALFYNPRIDAAYGLTAAGRLRLAWRMYRNTKRIRSATSYKAHLAMAIKLLELPPGVPGVVVECGCYQGASSAN